LFYVAGRGRWAQWPAKQVGPKAKEAYLPGWLFWYNQIKSMVAKIGVVICILAAILLYGTGILFWLVIISALVILIAGAYIDEKNR
jgi:hypothetical protein